MTDLKKSLLFVLLWFAAAFLTAASPARALPENKILKWDFHRNAAKDTTTLSFTGRPEFSPCFLANPDRIVVDIKDCFFPQVHQSFNVPDSETVKAIRISQNQKNQVRLVLDLKKESAYKINYKKDSQTDQFLLYVVLTGQKAPESRAVKNLPIPVLSPFPSASDSGKSGAADSGINAAADSGTKDSEAKEDSMILFDSEMPADLFDSSQKDLFENDQFNAQDRPSSFSISGSIKARGAVDTHDNHGNEHKTSLRNRVIIETEYKKELTLSVISDYLAFGDDNHRDDYDLDFYEAYYRYANSRFSLTLGKQIIRWGKTDQISPVDTLNPEDLREGMIPDYEERKMPVWMADLVMRFPKFSIEGVYIPVFEESEIDYFNSDWAIFTHTRKDITDTPIPDPQKAYFRNIMVHETEPDDTGLKGEYAIKLSGTLNKWDIGATYHYTWEDLPYFTSFPVKNINVNGTISDETLLSSLDNAHLTMENIETEFRRTSITGLFFETTLSDFGIRGEAAWQTGESFLTSSLTSVRSPTLYYIIGADYTSPSEWYINLQLGHKHIYDYDSSILYFKKDSVYLSGEISRKLFFSWLKGALLYSLTLNDNELYLSPRLEYTYITNLEVILGANIFQGSRTSFIGRFDQDDQIFLDLKYTF